VAISIPQPAAAPARVPAWRARRLSVAALVLAVVGLGTLLAAFDVAGGRPVWERLHQLAAALGGFVIIWRATAAAEGHVRLVRVWITVAFAIWSLSELLRALELGVELAVGPVSRPAPSDLALPAILLTAIGAYVADLHGRVSSREEAAVYLDGAIASAASTAILLAIFGGPAAAHPELLSLLAQGILLLAIVAGTILLELAVLAPLQLRGAWLLVLGLTLGGIGFVGSIVASGSVAGTGLATAVSIGVLVVALGGAGFTDVPDTGLRYRRYAQRLRDVIPVLAVAPMPVLLLMGDSGAPPALGVVKDVLAALALMAVVGRQSLMLVERGVVLSQLEGAVAAAERRAHQIAGLEAVGRILAGEGPSSSSLEAVSRYLGDHFGHRLVRVYVVDGTGLRLGAQRGYADVDAVPDASRGIVGRVAHTRAMALVPDVSIDPDYVAVDPAVRSAVSAPMIVADRLLGVLHVESADRLDPSDMIAVAAVADQVAGALALGGERHELVEEKNFISAVLDTLGALVIVVDRQGRVVRFNAACSAVSGYAMEELRGRASFDFLVPLEERQLVRATVDGTRDAVQSHEHENDWVRKDGGRRRIAWSNTPVLDSEGTVQYMIATGVDVTERRHLEAQLAHRALHDPLTGLANRTLLADRIDHALARRDSTVALLFLDLDDFKRINDTFGHITGDVVLTELSRRLAAVLRPGDTAARIGGDEFAVLLEDVAGEPEASAIADRVVASLSRPLMLEGGAMVVHVSTGVALSGETSPDGDTLLRNADLAMYWAKSRGRARIEIYDASMYAAMRERRDLETLLRQGVDRDEFIVHLQPVVELQSRRQVGMEALVRWRQPERGLVYPGEFLALAEDTGLIVPIGRIVLAEACRLATTGAMGSGDGGWISINLSARQFQDPDLIADVTGVLAASGLEPGRLVLEITETLLMDDLEGTIGKLHELKAIGVRLAVDDFGTGYSSLSYLRRFPVDLLKIDRSFVADVASDKRQRAFVGAIVALGQSLSIATLAEGIETEEQRQILEAIGCEFGQGYLFGRPAAATLSLVPSLLPVPDATRPVRPVALP
jgi:diguanylate cyclase (GGDEF)-like protein/PAS domain S-box-containing protein